METLFADFRNRFLNNPPECRNCGAQTRFFLEGMVFSKNRSGFLIKNFIAFQCPECKMPTIAVFLTQNFDSDHLPDPSNLSNLSGSFKLT